MNLDIDIDNPFIGIFSPQPWDTQVDPEEAQPPNCSRSQSIPISTPLAPDAATPAETSVETSGGTRSGKRFRAQQKRLGFIHLDEWDADESYNEDPPTSLRYEKERS